MKELDVLLERFTRSGLPAISDAWLGDLERLLESPDPDLLTWLTGTGKPVDPTLVTVLAFVRTHARPTAASTRC